jgi:hypothetical protein
MKPLNLKRRLEYCNEDLERSNTLLVGDTSMIYHKFLMKPLNLQRRLEYCNEDLERSNTPLLVGDNIKEVPCSN